jgi:hypothetical protein
MYVYLANTGDEIFLPFAVNVKVTEEELVFIDASSRIVAVFPARCVVIYSSTRLSDDDPDNKTGMLS